LSALLNIRGRLQVMVGPLQKDCVRARLENFVIYQTRERSVVSCTCEIYDSGRTAADFKHWVMSAADNERSRQGIVNVHVFSLSITVMNDSSAQGDHHGERGITGCKMCSKEVNSIHVSTMHE
ncbi:hypothetical protein KCU93_g501, partial [Aureobasidium melanogenum]